MILTLTWLMVSLILAPNLILLKAYIDSDPMLKYLQNNLISVGFMLAFHIFISLPIAKILVSVK